MLPHEVAPSSRLPADSRIVSDTPKAYDGFGGDVGRIFSTSEPSWPAVPTAPEGAPNVIVMLADDLGFADLACYGSEIDTPNLDAIAAGGVRYTNFHVNPMCSPTRASMLTGLNHHMAGMGHVAHSDPGFPGYAHELRDDAITMAEVFRDNGWASLMVGKWHLCKDAHLSDAGPRHSWPLQKGFERYYGILDGFTNFHQPHRLYEDNHHLPIDQYPDDYYFTDDLTDQALHMIDEVRASHPTKPFFLYFSHGAVHAPLQAKAHDIEKYRGMYDAGWDEIRRRRFERQLELGVVAPHTRLPPRNDEAGHAVGPWDELTDDEKLVFARYMEIFAGMVDNIDQNVGRLRAHLEALGEWDNTIIVFTSDNGGSREGQELGTSAYFRTLVSQTRADSLDSVDLDLPKLDTMGGPTTLPHYPMGWAMVSSTPFRLYKINTHQGGHQVPLIVHWPDGITAPGELRRQYQHVTDLLPTLAELCGVTVPTMKRGQAVPAPAGSSMVSTLHKADAPTTHPEQYYEQIGHRGFYRNGWSAVTCRQPRRSFATETWELHNLDDDPTETVDLAAEHPEKLAELQEAWEQAAWANQVFPLDEGNYVKMMQQPPWNAALAEPAVFRPGMPTVERWRSLQLISSRSFRVDIDVDIAVDDDGVLVAHGDQGGGYSLAIDDGRLVHSHNGYGEMTLVDCGPVEPGRRTITLDVADVGDVTWEPRVFVDAVEVGAAGPVPRLMAMAPFEGIDIGIDRRSPVNWDLYERKGPARFTGTIHRVTYTPGELAPDNGSQYLQMLKELGTKYE